MNEEDLLVMGKVQGACSACGEEGRMLVLNCDRLSCPPCWEELLEDFR